MVLSRLGAAVSTVAGLAALLVAPDATASTSLDWDEDCGSGVRCDTLTVPIDWQRGGDTMGVKLARRAATGNKIGTIVYLPGGPGDSGVDQLVSGKRVSDTALSRFDVIGIDPRGVKQSNSVMCDATLVDKPPNLNPDTGARYADVLAYSRNLGKSCRDNSNAVIDHLDSRNVARDVEALRVALGEQQITLYSRSYGTLAAQTYAEMFPNRVRGVVLDSVFDHTLSTRELLAGSARAVEDMFDQFAGWCGHNADCVIPGRDAKALFDKLYQRAERGELGISPTTLSWTVMRRFMYKADWKGLAAWLTSMDSGNPAAATLDPTPQVKNFNGVAFCSDHRIGFSSEREWMGVWQHLKRLAPTMRSSMVWQVTAICAASPLPITNPQARPKVWVPVLILNSRHDPATPLESAVHVNRMIPRSVLVTYNGSGHGVYDHQECMPVTDRYLIDRALPAPGTTC